ncbi:hypothetical protein NP233_g2543 [Leucocoprinus birnbaumii]|uniref:NAD-dependent epimerase/dehydratase domain-containing protein n=1 Tax=Leucocoprinus birnbaumii TaxID=56174 RepID=A0AAD5YYZ4_9AGAR|nr:hypothetical protein NP233_g2543 [Leucocoprinus birnbaumii]
MTIVPPPCKVLVTGANGYIGMWIVRSLLEHGYLVRAAVRAKNKGAHLVEYFGKRGFGHDRLEIVVVKDIMQPGAFDDAVNGVEAIQHTAAPIASEGTDPQGGDSEFIKPAVQGTIGILQSALLHGSNVKRIVLVSSAAAITNWPKEPTVFSEEDWNTTSLEDISRNGINAEPESAYRASKTIAERAAWDFWEKHRSEVAWDLVVTNPTVVFGPCIHEISGGPTNLNTSLKWLYNIVVNTASKSEAYLYFSSAWIDIRDVALAHTLVLQRENAGGERMILSTGPFICQDLVDVANKLAPYPLPNHPPSEGFPGLQKTYLVDFKVEKLERILAIPRSEMKTLEESVRDTLKEFADRGW